ncbi:MAG: PA2778 family cysteine peptidase, partial [Bdellovibrionaceae bacterium]|nr:PA2778 family cysteine peptidase [Pseudobdellovibrionaceae bacterium]
MSLQEFQKPIRISNVPFINQQVGQCGPATLTMALNYLGNGISVDEVAQQVYTPGMKGSLQTDMVTAVRRQGLLAIPIDSLDSLLREVSKGNPVIVFENLALSWFPQWHYALVFGYDLSKETVTMHSGSEKNKEWDIRKFERSWKLGDYWGLVILPADQLSATASELVHANAAVGLEQVGKKEQALTAYKTMLSRWSTSL